MAKRWLAGIVAVALMGAGCSSGSDDGSSADRRAGDRPSTTVAAEPIGTGACDPADRSACLLPWPNDRFTRADPTAPTGRRVDLPADGTPANASGTHIDPAEWNRNDGFAPASSLITLVPGLDVEASKLPPVTDIGASLDDASPLVLVDATTGDRLAAWAELDANAEDPAKRALLIQPAAALPEGHRIVVGLRGLVDGDGAPVERSKGFAAQIAHPDRQTDAVVGALADVGVDADELDVAWGFTVGSAESITGRLRHMWTRTERELGDGAPAFEVTSNQPSGPARVVQGTFEVPKYLTGDGGPGSVLDDGDGDDPDRLPVAKGTMNVDFVCTVPAAATGDDPAGSVIYGHGLLGTRMQTLDLGMLGATVGLSFCGIDYLGMSASDVATIVASFADLSTFRTVPDRLQEAHLGFLLLGRLLRSADGFAADPAFQDADGRSLLDPDEVALLGASQGGILGGVASALTDDWRHVILAVPGMGYNLLLRRSIDFDEFFPQVEQAYPDELDQTLVLDLLEQLWQRGENAGYAQHLTSDPLDGAPAKDVLLLEAFGDHQVANVATEKLARTLGIGRRVPTLADGRSHDVEPFWAIPALSLPHDGSGLVMWDFATPTPPAENVPNRAGDDPHGKLSSVPEALTLVLSFVQHGRIVDVCGGRPCRTAG